MNDWRKTSKGKPSKKWISYLRKAAKIQKDMQLKKDIYSNPLLKRQHKELTNLKYRATLQDIKDYSKGSYSNIKYIKRFTHLTGFEDEVLKVKPKTKTKTVKPKKEKTVKKKSKITKKSLYDEDTYILKSDSKESKIKNGYRAYLPNSTGVRTMKDIKNYIKEELKPKGYKTKIYKRTNFPKKLSPNNSNYWVKVLVKNGKIVKK